MKRTKITEIEQFAIKAVIEEGISVEEMAEKLNRTVAFLTKNCDILTSKKDNKYITKTVSGKDGVTVMTKAASEEGDEVKSMVSDKSKAIHKIYNG